MVKRKNTEILTARVSDDLAEWTRYAAWEKNLSVSGFIARLLEKEKDRGKGNLIGRIYNRWKR